MAQAIAKAGENGCCLSDGILKMTNERIADLLQKAKEVIKIQFATMKEAGCMTAMGETKFDVICANTQEIDAEIEKLADEN